MIQYRPFRNSDPPAIAEIWRSQQSTRSLAQSAGPAVLDRLVFSKPYFRNPAFIVADDGERPIGFVHVGNASSESGEGLDLATGVIALLLVTPHRDEDEVARGLLERAEAWLRSEGAEKIIVGGYAPNAAPYYMGLFGGCLPAGIPTSNERLTKWVQDWGVVEDRAIAILHRSLAGFRPVVNRDQMQIRRRYQVEAEFDPPANSWWEACTVAYEHRTRFVLKSRTPARPAGHATFWDMEPIASSWGVHACGLLDISIVPSEQRKGLGTFLLCESLRQMQSQGATMVECQCSADDEVSKAFFEQLGFEEVDRGVVYRRETTGSHKEHEGHQEEP